jgi:hypothetical protein
MLQIVVDGSQDEPKPSQIVINIIPTENANMKRMRSSVSKAASSIATFCQNFLNGLLPLFS